MEDRSAEAFVRKLDEDKELQEQVKQCVLAEQHIAAMAKLLGFEFSAEELEAVLRERWRRRNCEDLFLQVTFSERPGF